MAKRATASLPARDRTILIVGLSDDPARAIAAKIRPCFPGITTTHFAQDFHEAINFLKVRDDAAEVVYIDNGCKADRDQVVEAMATLALGLGALVPGGLVILADSVRRYRSKFRSAKLFSRVGSITDACTAYLKHERHRMERRLRAAGRGA